jgi:hypothetical protein
MAAGYQELFLEQGTDFNFSITLDDIYMTPYDLSTSVPKGSIRKSYYSANTTADFLATSSDPANGVINLSLTNDITANIAAGRYVYDVTLKDNTNTITRILEGIVTVNPSVTRY